MQDLADDHSLTFSIIIPAYNYGGTLGRAVDSVLSQEGDDYEIIIVDDGSTDDTALVAKAYCDKFPEKITCYLQSNQGPAAARNKGASVSIGEYLFFLDADDEMAQDLLKTLRQYIQKEGAVDCLIGDHISIDQDGKTSYSMTHPLPDTRERCFSSYLSKQLNLSHCAKLVHRRVFDKVSYPVELRNSEDIPFVAHVLALYDCKLVSEPMAVVHKHRDSLRHNEVYARKGGEKVVDYVFNYDLLPGWAKKYEKNYRARRCLSLFRTLYLSGNKKESLSFFKKALSLSPFLSLRPGYLKKALRVFFSG